MTESGNNLYANAWATQYCIATLWFGKKTELMPNQVKPRTPNLRQERLA
jgi:hypothetical protein